MKKLITLLIVLVGGIEQAFGWGNVYINSKDNNWGSSNASYSTQLSVRQSNHYYIVLNSSNLTWEDGFFYFRFYVNNDDNISGRSIGAKDDNPIITADGYTNIGANENTFKLKYDKNISKILINLDYYDATWHLNAFKEVEYTISFSKPDSWDTPKAYVWTYNHISQDWPGTVMTNNEGIYTATVQGFEKAEVIFTDKPGGGNELSKKDLINKGIYNESGLYGIKATVTSAGYATFSSTQNVNFNGVEGLTAKKGKVNTDGSITWKTATTLAAGEGVLLQGVAGDYVIPVVNNADADTENNDFVAIPTKQIITQDMNSKKAYILANVSGTLGFYKPHANGSWCGAGTAYLNTTYNPAGARDFFALDDETTGIDTAKQEVKMDGEVFNLAGQRVAQSTKGLYIVNGKKVIIK